MVTLGDRPCLTPYQKEKITSSLSPKPNKHLSEIKSSVWGLNEEVGLVKWVTCRFFFFFFFLISQISEENCKIFPKHQKRAALLSLLQFKQLKNVLSLLYCYSINKLLIFLCFLEFILVKISVVVQHMIYFWFGVYVFLLPAANDSPQST